MKTTKTKMFALTIPILSFAACKKDSNYPGDWNMKKRSLLFILLIALACNVSAQTSKSKKHPAKKAASQKNQTAAKKATQSKAAVSRQPAVDNQSAYSNAIGLKFIYGISVTGKHFLDKNKAIEAIVRYRNYGSGVGSEFNFSGLYEYHGDISGATGLRWYGGGGIYLGHASFDYPANTSIFNFGITGVLGLEYKIKDVPLAISADWQPVFLFNAGAGFTGENGGLGIKYAF